MVTYLVHPKKIIFLQRKWILDTKVVWVSFAEYKGGFEEKVFFQSQCLCSDVSIFVYKHGKQSILAALYKCDNILLKYFRCYCANIVGAEIKWLSIELHIELKLCEMLCYICIN